MEVDLEEEDEDHHRSVTTMEDIPDEILTLIFARMTLYEVKKNVALVCKRWYNLSKNISFYKSLYIGPNFLLARVVWLLAAVPYLVKLEFHSRKDLNEILESVMGYNKRLRALKINSGRDHRVTRVRAGLLLKFIASCPHLKSLSLKRTTIDDPDLFFSKFSSVAPGLTKINFNHSVQFGTEALEAMASRCNDLEDVRVYCLSFNKLGSVTPYTNPPAEKLCTRMRSYLRVLKLNMLGLTDSIMPCIVQCEKLEKLHLYRLVHVHDENLVQLGTLNHLKVLVITVPRAISAHGWITLFSKPTMKHLEKLTISNSCTVNNQVLKVVSEHCTGLRALSLPGCREITEDGVSSIISSCSRILYLNLFSTKSSIIKAFRLIPQFLPSLRVLVFRPTDKTQNTFPEALKTMPHLEIREFYRYL